MIEQTSPKNPATDDVPCTPLETNRSVRNGARDRTAVWASASLIALAVGLYCPVAAYGFLNWDDPWYVLNNPLIKSWHPANLYDIATRVAVRNYAPLTMFSLLVEHTLFGLWPGGYHITNMLLHAANGVLVYFLVSRVAGSRFVGWGTAAWFAVHPVQLESVAWISSQKGLLSAAFLFASLLYWLKPDRTARDEAIGIGFFVLSLLAKALAIVQPPVVLAYDVLVRRVPFAQAFTRQIIPGFCALLLLLVTMGAQTSEIGGVRDHLAWGKGKILAVDSVILWNYVGMLAAPTDLCVLYDPPSEGIVGLALLASLGWVIVAAVAWRLRNRAPLVPFALLVFFLFLFPVLNFFPITTLMNDRYLYVPCIPIFALSVAGLERLLVTGWRQSRHNPDEVQQSLGVLTRVRYAIAMGVVLAAVAMYGTLASRHLPVWENSLALWTHAYSRIPQVTVVRMQLADALYTSGQTVEAVEMLEGTLTETKPDNADRKRIQRKLAEWRETQARTD